MLNPYFQKIMQKSPLSKDEAESVVNILCNEADPYQTAAFLSVLKYRGETPDELAGMAVGLQKKAIPVKVSTPVIDIVGTGGDRANTVNISTGSAILASACGIPVAKHGNRSVTSKSGSADVLEELGVNINCTAPQIVKCLNEAGIAFMFAPIFHPALKQIAPIRRGLNIPTIINLLCPMINPATPEYALIGVANEANLELISQAVLGLGYVKRALVFHGNGLDELSTVGPTIAYDIDQGQMKRLIIDPSSLGFSICSLKDLQGGDARLNASILKEVFAGHNCAVADTLILNAGAANWIFGRSSSLESGIQEARQVLKAGGALECLSKWVKLSNQMEK